MLCDPKWAHQLWRTCIYLFTIKVYSSADSRERRHAVAFQMRSPLPPTVLAGTRKNTSMYQWKQTSQQDTCKASQSCSQSEYDHLLLTSWDMLVQIYWQNDRMLSKMDRAFISLIQVLKKALTSVQLYRSCQVWRSVHQRGINVVN